MLTGNVRGEAAFHKSRRKRGERNFAGSLSTFQSIPAWAIEEAVLEQIQTRDPNGVVPTQRDPFARRSFLTLDRRLQGGHATF